MTYDFEDERATILYTREPCSGGMQGAYNIPHDTVVSIDVVPKRELTLLGLNLDPGEYKKSGGASGTDLASYHSEKAGITYVAYVGGEDDGEIRVIIYGPRAEDAHLHCPAPPGQADGDDNPGTESPDEDTGPLGDCPTIEIERSQNKPSQAEEYLLIAHIVGGDPRFTPTFKWSVSAGLVVSGQGTPSVKISTSGTDCRQVTITLEVGGVIPKGCQRAKTYTIKQSKP